VLDPGFHREIDRAALDNALNVHGFGVLKTEFKNIEMRMHDFALEIEIGLHF